MRFGKRKAESALAAVEVIMVILKSTDRIQIGWLAVCIPALILVGVVLLIGFFDFEPGRSNGES